VAPIRSIGEPSARRLVPSTPQSATDRCSGLTKDRSTVVCEKPIGRRPFRDALDERNRLLPGADQRNGIQTRMDHWKRVEFDRCMRVSGETCRVAGHQPGDLADRDVVVSSLMALTLPSKAKHGPLAEAGGPSLGGSSRGRTA